MCSGDYPQVESEHESDHSPTSSENVCMKLLPTLPHNVMVWCLDQSITLVLPFVTVSVRLSIRPSVPLYGFSLNIIFEYFSKNHRENSIFIKIGQEHRVLYITVTIYFWSYLAQLFLDWKIFQTKVLEEIKTSHFVFSNFFFFENRAVYEIMWKNILKLDGPQMTIWRMRIACWITKPLTPHTHTHTHTHTLAICNTYCFPLQQYLQVRASILHLYVNYLFLFHNCFANMPKCGNS